MVNMWSVLMFSAAFQLPPSLEDSAAYFIVAIARQQSASGLESRSIGLRRSPALMAWKRIRDESDLIGSSCVGKLQQKGK